MPHRLIPKHARERLGRRGLVLLLFGVAWLIQAVAVALVPDVPPTGLWHEDIPNLLLAAMWFVSGVLSIGYAFVRKHRNDTLGFLAVSAMPMFLAGSYGVSTFTLLAATNPALPWLFGPLGFFLWLAIAVALSVVASWPEEQDGGVQ